MSLGEAQRDVAELEAFGALSRSKCSGAESIWVGLGETAALRIYTSVTANTLGIH